MFLEIGQQPGQIAAPLEHRTRRLRHGHAHLPRQGSDASVVLPSPGGPCRRIVVQRLAAPARGLHGDPKLLAK
jgi:hypothetical protein